MSEFVSPNRVALVEVARLLAPLLPEIAFVGGQVAELLVTDPAATGIRPTCDVDVLVAATTRLEYYKIEKRLTALGLKHDMSEDSILCRWLTPGGHQVDVIAKEEGVLGFSNRWYPAALERSVEYHLESDLIIRIPPATVFLATKWDAFVSPERRNSRDYLASSDFEDIVAVVAGRPELLEEAQNEDLELRTWLAEQAQAFLADESADYALDGALPDARLVPGLVSEVRSRFTALAGLMLP